jgi:hypothetical protein
VSGARGGRAGGEASVCPGPLGRVSEQEGEVDQRVEQQHEAHARDERDQADERERDQALVREERLGFGLGLGLGLGFGEGARSAV